MQGVNKVIILGTVGKDPIFRYTAGGKGVANFSLATNEEWGTGEAKEKRTEWHSIVVWGKAAEYVGSYIVKGCKVYVEGKLQTRSYEDKDGKKVWKTEINAFTVQSILAKKKDEEPHAIQPDIVEELNDEDCPF